MSQHRLQWTVCASLVLVLSMLAAGPAHAAPPERAWRFFLDTNVISYDWVKTMQRGVPSERSNVVSLGPSQLGASRLWIPTTPLGFGVGYLINPRWLVDVRAGFGADVFASDHDDRPNVVAWSFMPGLSWLPERLHGKLFLKFSPTLDFVQRKQGRERDRYFGGCFSVGAGSFFFTSERASADLGLFFEGRFPDVDRKPDNVKVEYTDLRLVVRAGLSLWH